MKQNPVGIFDSGLGGASLLREALALLPNENYIYYGDNANAPYGERTEEEITLLTINAAQKLVQMGAKAIVLACNTATATCINEIRMRFCVPVISVEPAIKPASMLKGSGKILMMATSTTTKLERYLALQQRMEDPSRIINIPCPGLVDRIEQGVFDTGMFDDLLDGFIGSYKSTNIDAVVLGCTHYVFIQDAIDEYIKRSFGYAVHFFDGNEATVKQLGRVLQEHKLQNENGQAKIEFFTSGDALKIKPIFNSLLSR